MDIIITDREGKVHELSAEPGWSLMEVIREAGMPIKAECGGFCACATCHIYLDDGWIDRVPSANEEEAELLDMAFDIEKNSRLCCQITMTSELDGLRATLAPDEL